MAMDDLKAHARTAADALFNCWNAATIERLCMALMCWIGLMLPPQVAMIYAFKKPKAPEART